MGMGVWCGLGRGGGLTRGFWAVYGVFGEHNFTGTRFLGVVVLGGCGGWGEVGPVLDGDDELGEVLGGIGYGEDGGAGEVGAPGGGSVSV